MIDSIYNILLAILNKEIRGYVTPSEFNLLATQVQREIFYNYFNESNRLQNRKNKGMVNPELSDILSYQNQQIQRFLTRAEGQTVANGVLTKPADLYYMYEEGISLADGTPVSPTSEKTLKYSTSIGCPPSDVFPAYVDVDGKIEIYPETITEVDLLYIRTPKDPKWTYTVAGDTPLFNISANDYQDFELGPAEFDNIVIRMASYFGVNIREADIVQYAESKDNKKVKEDNN